MAGSVLPAMNDRLSTTTARVARAVRLTARRRKRRLHSTRAAIQPEYTLNRPSNCLTNQDHLTRLERDRCQKQNRRHVLDRTDYHVARPFQPAENSNYIVIEFSQTGVL